jgi:hypothetical protein
MKNMVRNFKLKAEDIKPLKTGLGGCLATDKITVDGERVSFMYRQKTLRNLDSGWCFFSGIDENDEYINNPNNTTVYDVNTIANYDPSIIPFLDSPMGSVFERDQKTGNWHQVFDFQIPE